MLLSTGLIVGNEGEMQENGANSVIYNQDILMMTLTSMA